MGFERWVEGVPYYQLEDDYLYHTGITGYEYSLSYTGIPGAVTIFRDGRLLIEKGYRWDGCTPKFSIFDMVIGTPEGEICPRTGESKTYFASLVHDALYQLSEHTFSRNERTKADELFLNLLNRDGFRAAKLYYAVVSIFGRFLWGPQRGS